ncbi:50S ribosomal protein L25/general stress protein Ctc [soil metagenome]
MSTAVTLVTEPREPGNTRTAKKLRKTGKVPAVIYGHKQEPVHISVAYDALDKAIRVQHARVLDLTINGKAEKVLIRELQWDHLGSFMLHADFERVDANERVKVTIPVKLKNAPKNTGGGNLDQPLHALHIECLAIAIPEDHTIDITTLTLGHPIHVSDLKLPEGVVVLEAKEMVVVQLKLPGAEAVDATLPVEGGVGPEVIKKEKKADDEDDDKKK